MLLQCPDRYIGALGDIKDIGGKPAVPTGPRLAHHSLRQGPQSAQYAEKRRLAGSVGPRDEEVGAPWDAQGEVADEGVAGGGEDHGTVEGDLVLRVRSEGMRSYI